MDITQLITVTVIAILAVISPGPDFVVVTRNSLHSWRVGIATVFGIVAGNALWVGASLMGVSLLISQTVVLFSILKWIGAAYLMWIGYKSLRAKKQRPEEIEGLKSSEGKAWTTRSAFTNGLLTNILNPKCGLFFLSFFSVVLTPETPTILQAMYGFEVTLIALIWFSLLATILSTKAVKAVFAKIGIWLERVTGAILIALGIKLAFTER